MQWSTVSKAMLKSNRTRTAQFPESTDNKMSFVTLNRADSILCLALKADWKGSKILLEIKYGVSWFKTKLRTFRKKGNLEIGL